jgi:hypothetical protein
MTTVCIFAPDLNHELETIGFYLRLSGADVVFATQPTGNERSEHPWSLQRLRQTQNLRWISDEPNRIDLLISEAFIEAKYMKQRAHWASLANEVAFLFPRRGMTLSVISATW